jgi:hypothetical protein
LLVEVAADDSISMAFELKRALSLVRGRHPAETLLIAASADASAALRERGLASYIDGFVRAPADISRRRTCSCRAAHLAAAAWRDGGGRSPRGASICRPGCRRARARAGRALQCGEDRPAGAAESADARSRRREPVVSRAGGGHLGRARRDRGAHGGRLASVFRVRGTAATASPKASTSPRRAR